MPNPTPGLLRGRQAAEALMVDACTITREGSPVTNPQTAHVSKPSTTVYAGKCRVQQQAPASRPHELGGAEVWLQRLELQLPMAVTGVASDDLVVITASTLDPDLLSRMWRVRELTHKTHATMRRYQIEEVTG